MYEEWDVERGERKYDDEKLVQSQGQSGVNPEGPQSFVIITFNMIILFILWGTYLDFSVHSQDSFWICKHLLAWFLDYDIYQISNECTNFTFSSINI